jgi:phosphoribosylformylglycinamidine synthase subunit PurL
MVGLIEDLSRVTRATFREPGAAIVLLGEPTSELGASEYLTRIHHLTAGTPPGCDLERERSLIETLLECISGGLILSAHDCSDGGVAIALAECCVAERAHQIGADITLNEFDGMPLRALLFGEAQGRAVVSTAQAERVLGVARNYGLPARIIGSVNETSKALRISAGGTTLSVSLKDMDAAYHEAIPALMSRVDSDAALLEHVAVGAV